jgi:hypothetical protein
VDGHRDRHSKLMIHLTLRGHTSAPIHNLRTLTILGSSSREPCGPTPEGDCFHWMKLGSFCQEGALRPRAHESSRPTPASRRRCAIVASRAASHISQPSRRATFAGYRMPFLKQGRGLGLDKLRPGLTRTGLPAARPSKPVPS